MITKRKINIPIFDYKLTIVIFDDWEELKEILPNYDLDEEARAVTLSQYGASLVAVNSRRGSSIVHEAEHVKNKIWEYIGYIPQRDNDEVDAYVITYIKVIESAVNFWFKDDDYKGGNKVYKYFREA